MDITIAIDVYFLVGAALGTVAAYFLSEFILDRWG